MPPNSSTTSAMWTRDSRICSSRSSTGIDGATNSTLRTIRPSGTDLLIDRIGHHVLDMQHADNIVERVAIDRHAAVALLHHLLGRLLERRVLGQRHDIGARHHNLGGGELVQLEDVGEEPPLVRIDGLFLLMFLDQLLELLAQVALGRVAAPPLPQPMQ